MQDGTQGFGGLQNLQASGTGAKKEFIESLKGLHRLYSDMAKYRPEDYGDTGMSLVDFADKILSMEQNEAREYIRDIYKGSPRQLSDKEESELLEIIYKKPKNYVMPIPKIMDVFFGQDYDKNAVEECDLKVSSRKSKKEYFVKDCRLVIPPDMENFILPKTLSPYDREVLCSVCSIVESGCNYMTLHMIAEAMYGSRQTGEHTLKEVDDSMNRLRATLANFDWTEHAKMKNVAVNDDITLIKNDNLILAEAVECRINGMVETMFHIVKPPILLQYAKAVGQIITIDRKMMDIPGMRNTRKNVLIRNNLCRRLSWGRNSTETSSEHVVLFRTLFEDMCGLNFSPNPKIKCIEQKRARDTVSVILTAWKENGFIKDFAEKRDGKIITGVKIMF